jgi:AraC-like DNA-binding protein
MILEGLREKEIFTDNSPFRIAVNTRGNFNYPSHWHNALELVYAERNSCIINLNNHEYKLAEKDILLVAPGDIHSFHANSGEGICYFVQFDFTKLFGFSEAVDYKAYQYKSELISSRDNKTVYETLKEQLIKIIEEYKERKFASDLFINARFLDITVILSRNLVSNHDRLRSISKTNELIKLDKAFEYLDQNYQRQISLKEVAGAAGFSEYHFSRVFKKATEKNFHSYLNEYRVKKAERLLFEDVTITHAAFASGFNSIVTFNRIFKQIKGCSPSEYIKKRV